ncbi:hypothetical protein F8568_046085 [Actinomadura sp. LD22]|uniref:Uncharacterized protein n=1 Tax=Actinomadura physcomitrii TaxID=2650748 RepID=A0A6I4MY83_9ACTN|nr:hypothetical protein [Actinomadura physcomitrii]MWA07569.1 hypothetical protein [Actinomadura physcomitrii]
MAPREFTDPGTAARERELIFGRVPSIVAHSSELAEPAAEFPGKVGIGRPARPHPGRLEKITVR